jgi:hypothetical protein
MTILTISIVNNSPGIQEEQGKTVKWINNDSLPHTATSAKPDNREVPTADLFDTCISILYRAVKTL